MNNKITHYNQGSIPLCQTGSLDWNAPLLLRMLATSLNAYSINGGQILMPETAIHYAGWISKFLDTEENLICVMQYDNSAR